MNGPNTLRQLNITSIEIDVGPAGCSMSPTSIIRTATWYTFVPPFTGTYTFDVCDVLFDSRISVLSSCSLASGTSLACNDDACGHNGWQSKTNPVVLQVNSPVYIVVGGFGSNDYGTS